MKGDAILEMAARCGDLPDSVMAAPGLEYVGEKSAEWEALCVDAAAWVGEGPDADKESSMTNAAAEFYRTRSYVRARWALSGLALFARLMAIVTREE